MTATHYDALGVAPSASLEEIRFAYRRLARIVHPDRHHGRALGETAALRAAMAEINEAWAVLSDPGRRQAYDESLGLTGGAAAVGDRLAAKPAGRTLGTARATRAWASAATLTAPPTRRLLALLGAAALAAGAWQLRTVVAPATAPVGQRSGPGAGAPAGPTTTAAASAPSPPASSPAPSSTSTSAPLVRRPPAGPLAPTTAPPLLAVPGVDVTCTDAGPQVRVVRAGLADVTLAVHNPRREAVTVAVGTTVLATAAGEVAVGGAHLLHLEPGQTAEVTAPVAGVLAPVQVAVPPEWALVGGTSPCR